MEQTNIITQLFKRAEQDKKDHKGLASLTNAEIIKAYASAAHDILVKDSVTFNDTRNVKETLEFLDKSYHRQNPVKEALSVAYHIFYRRLTDNEKVDILDIEAMTSLADLINACKPYCQITRAEAEQALYDHIASYIEPKEGTEFHQGIVRNPDYYEFADSAIKDLVDTAVKEREEFQRADPETMFLRICDKVLTEDWHNWVDTVRDKRYKELGY